MPVAFCMSTFTEPPQPVNVVTGARSVLLPNNALSALFFGLSFMCSGTDKRIIFTIHKNDKDKVNWVQLF
jgi:hypothetical protein